MSIEAVVPPRRAGVTWTLEAGGTAARPRAIMHPAQGRRLRLILEIGILFMAGPLLIRFGIFGLGLPLFVVLAPVFVALLSYLLWDGTFKVAREATQGFTVSEGLSILAIFIAVGAIVTSFVSQRFPEDFLSLPLGRPVLWGRIMLLYPVLSVVAQELIYRTFFFHRYGPVFADLGASLSAALSRSRSGAADLAHASARWLMIVTNAGLFGLGHIIYGSYVSLVLSALFGVLLAWRYERTHSFWAVWLEHSLYGCLVFTIGLGRYFFTGVGAVG